MGPQFNPCGRRYVDVRPVDVVAASMGPQFNPCGRAACGTVIIAKSRLLQWGRSLIPAEGGASIWTARHAEELQWGRSLIPAEGSIRQVRLNGNQASMGPQFNPCGRPVNCQST